MLAAAVAGIALLVAACGGGSGRAAGAASTADQKAIAYAQCMRSHGKPGWPDPDSHGDFRISPEKQHLNGSLMRSADQACRHPLPNGGQQTAAQEQQAFGQALKFSACMRAHGLPGFRDPTVEQTATPPGGPGAVASITTRLTSAPPSRRAASSCPVVDHERHVSAGRAADRQTKAAAQGWRHARPDSRG
jgi:hypothetical protein